MEKILNIDGRQVKLKSTGALLLRYKSQFGRDAIKDIYRMDEAIDKETGEMKDIEAFDIEVFYNLVWTLAKTGDPSIPPPMEWLDTFETFPLEDIIPEAQDLLYASFKSTVKGKK